MLGRFVKATQSGEFAAAAEVRKIDRANKLKHDTNFQLSSALSRRRQIFSQTMGWPAVLVAEALSFDRSLIYPVGHVGKIKRQAHF